MLVSLSIGTLQGSVYSCSCIEQLTIFERQVTLKFCCSKYPVCSLYVKYFLSGMKIALSNGLFSPAFVLNFLQCVLQDRPKGLRKPKPLFGSAAAYICMCMLTSLCSSEMIWNYHKTAAALSVLVVSVTLSCEFNLLI
jgi:hypothetical protein